MTPSERIGNHLRRNVVGYLALFVALSGTSYAANKITTNQIAKNAIKSKLIKDGQVKSSDVADDGLTGTDINESTLQGVPVLLPDGSVATAKIADSAVTQPKLSFDPATQAEFDAYRAQVASAGTINDPGNPVQFSQLRGVPAGFADGTDDTGGAPGDNSLAQAEPGTAAEDEIRDGAIDSEDLADGTIANSDISPTAGIADTKLNTISSAGKVADTALSPNAALLNRSPQSFSGTNNFNGNVDFNGAIDASFGNAENFVIQASQTGTDATTPFVSNLTNNTTSGLQRAASFSNLSGTGTTDFLISLANIDSDTPVGTGINFSGIGAVGTGIDFDSNGGTATAVDASDGGVGTALAIGSNDITTSGATISSTELERLDGTVPRSVGIPITSFVNVTDDANLDFTASDGTSPDFGASGDKPYIEWDDDTDGGGGNIADIDKVAGQFVVPADYGSNGRIRILYREFNAASVPEHVVCDAAAGDGSFGATDSANANGVPALIFANLDPVVTYSPQVFVTLRCHVEDGSGGTTADDPVRLFSAAFTYDADH